MGEDIKTSTTSNNSNSHTFTKKSDAGKGDYPRNISRQFWDNYDQIDWHKENKKIDITKQKP